jgi:hypothetical protein
VAFLLVFCARIPEHNNAEMAKISTFFMSYSLLNVQIYGDKLFGVLFKQKKENFLVGRKKPAIGASI